MMLKTRHYSTNVIKILFSYVFEAFEKDSKGWLKFKSEDISSSCVRRRTRFCSNCSHLD